MIIQCIQAAVAKLYTLAPELKPNNRPACIQSCGFPRMCSCFGYYLHFFTAHVHCFTEN